jgi:tRNA(His) 5'-end guanylyltransferase
VDSDFDDALFFLKDYFDVRCDPHYHLHVYREDVLWVQSMKNHHFPNRYLRYRYLNHHPNHLKNHQYWYLSPNHLFVKGKIIKAEN